MCVDTTCGAIKLNFLASGRRWQIVIWDRLLPILKCVKISRNSCTTTRSRKKEKATWLLFSLEVQGDRDIYVNFYFHPLKKMCCARCLVNVPLLAAPRWPARSRASGWTPSRTWRAASRATQRPRAPRARRRPPLPPPCPPCWRPATSSRSRAAILELQTKVIRRFAKISQSRRRPLLGPSPGWKRLLVLSNLRHY